MGLLGVQPIHPFLVLALAESRLNACRGISLEGFPKSLIRNRFLIMLGFSHQDMAQI